MNLPQRKYTRLPGYDYSAPGAYFITLCSHEKRCVFGRIQEGKMQLDLYGQIVQDCWIDIPSHRPTVALDEFTVMPNHVHGIVLVQDAAITCKLGDVVGAFKASVSREVTRYRAASGLAPANVWQRSFHERIIRDERELDDTRRYIGENPLHWAKDKLNMRSKL